MKNALTFAQAAIKLIGAIVYGVVSIFTTLIVNSITN